jgi:hypothetical protein
MTTKLQNPKKLTFIFAGISVETFASDEFLKITKKSDAFASSVGANAEVTREQINDERADIELTIPRTAGENGAFTAIHEADKLSGNGSGVAPLLIKDELGNDIHTAKECWIVRAPDATYSTKSTNNVWKFEASNLISIHGGS